VLKELAYIRSTRIQATALTSEMRVFAKWQRIGAHVMHAFTHQPLERE